MVKVFIDGAVGTTGLEIRDRLTGRADIALIALPDDLRKDAAARHDALNAADIVVLCLPDDAAREAVALIDNPHTRVIDASTAHRTDPAWTYGFPELEPGARARVGSAMRVSNPGCYPTGFLAIVRPLVAAGLVPGATPLSVNAISGYSGGGRAMIAAFEDAADLHATDTAFRLYALGLGHKHVGEMQAHAGLMHPPLFTPAVANAYRGMLVEVPLHLHALPGQPTLAALRDAIAEAYEGCPLVSIGNAGNGLITLEQAAGSDRIDLFVLGSDRLGQARLVAALDNLGKGAAGAAVQNLNLMAGLPDTEGLRR